MESPANPSHHQIDEGGRTQINETHKVSGYEQFREERIKENLRRMQKLGIFDLSLKLKSVKPTTRKNNSNRKSPHALSPLSPSGPPRRSSRLQNVTPITYSEVHLTKKNSSLEDDRDLLGVGSRPEVYTDEHEKLLGSTEMSWVFFVDGYGQDGRRIYDPVMGKTCHQCRQKTLGHRTHCSKCGMVQGQFCGDCLYMRYGEHVLEAKQNSNWICPVCRGICNCSLCRQAKGWPPTGPLYKKISQLGFKSVAHYLIQTQRSETDSDKTAHNNVPVSAKRSLPFSDTEATSEHKDSRMSNDDHHKPGNPKFADNKVEDDDEFKGEKQEKTHIPEHNKHDCHKVLTEPESEDNKTDEDIKGNKEEKISQNSKRKSPDSIAGRLRQRRRTGKRAELEPQNDSIAA